MVLVLTALLCCIVVKRRTEGDLVVCHTAAPTTRCTRTACITLLSNPAMRTHFLSVVCGKVCTVRFRHLRGLKPLAFRSNGVFLCGCRTPFECAALSPAYISPFSPLLLDFSSRFSAQTVASLGLHTLSPTILAAFALHSSLHNFSRTRVLSRG